MSCPRCAGALIPTLVHTDEGALPLVRCFNCGFASDRLMVQHRLLRPEPYSHSYARYDRQDPSFEE